MLNTGNPVFQPDPARAIFGRTTHAFTSPKTCPCKTRDCKNLVHTAEIYPPEMQDDPADPFGPQIVTKPGEYAFLATYCEPCVLAILKAEEEEERRDKRHRWLAKHREHWLEIWGGKDAGYHKTNPERLPFIEITKQIMDWHPNLGVGLLVSGPTGSGKSRSVYLLLKRLMEEHGILARIEPCIAFRHRIAAAARKDGDERERLVRQLSTAAILYLDDLGQMVNTDSAAEALLEIVERRTMAELPIVATTQFTGQAFIDSFRSKETGQAIARRLGEFCHKIHFPTKPVKP